jgi:hypothetical protein
MPFSCMVHPLGKIAGSLTSTAACIGRPDLRGPVVLLLLEALTD